MKNSYSAASVASRHLPGGQKLPFINSLSGWLLLKDALIPCRRACLKTVIWSFRRLMISNGRSRNIWKSVPSRRRPKEKISSTSLYRRNLAIIGRGAVLLLRRFEDILGGGASSVGCTYVLVTKRYWTRCRWQVTGSHQNRWLMWDGYI